MTAADCVARALAFDVGMAEDGRGHIVMVLM